MYDQTHEANRATAEPRPESNIAEEQFASEQPQEATPTLKPETPPSTEVDLEVEKMSEAIEKDTPTTEETVDLDGSIDKLKSKIRMPKRKPETMPQVRDEIAINIENIMEEGLQDSFLQLSPTEKQEFKIKGEKTALEIRSLLKSTRVKARQIFKLLVEWLQMLPGINKYFLEQEAKIKADKIITMKQIKDDQLTLNG